MFYLEVKSHNSVNDYIEELYLYLLELLTNWSSALAQRWVFIRPDPTYLVRSASFPGFLKTDTEISLSTN